ncbi:MAG: branched-chain amino acid ABC transporter permease [Planctomycetota bacterium]|nr:branched-chain amino acid ABC transporter permease [Planctomycetota bacterium]
MVGCDLLGLRVFLMDLLLQTLKDGLTIGSLYALIALGYTMVYGILKFINFAHSDVVVLGSWLSLVIADKLLVLGQFQAVPWWMGAVVLILAMALCGTIGFTIERLAYKPLRKAPRLNVLITAIGVSLFLQNIGQQRWAFGTGPRRIPTLLDDATLLSIGQVNVKMLDVVGAGTALLLMIALDWLVFHTRIGRAMRAVSHSPANASLMGIPVDRVISFTFVLGSTLAAAGGFLWAMKYETIKQPADASWTLLGLKAFVAAVVGGIGNIRGAMLGGLAIGLLENFGVAYISASMRDVYVFSLLIVVLLVRPGGILGKAVVEKV